VCRLSMELVVLLVFETRMDIRRKSPMSYYVFEARGYCDGVYIIDLV